MPDSPTSRRASRSRIGALAVVGALAPALAPGAAAAPATEFTTDTRGYVGTAAYCQGSAVAVAFGRTDGALVAICSGPDGQLQYRGVRLSDESALMLPARADDDDGFVAANGDVGYHVSSAELVVRQNDSTLVRQSMVQYYRAPTTPS